MELYQIFSKLGIAVGLGLLVGLQRERSASLLAGFRTFPLVTAFGAICALLADRYGGWAVGAGLLAVASVIVVGNVAKWKAGKIDPGLTTEISLLLMFGVGAYVVNGEPSVSIAVGGGVAVLLYLKPQLHSLAAKIGDADFKAIMQFALITLVIMPVLPNQGYGPFAVLNPQRIWLMVVLIVSVNLAGYIFYKFLGQQVGSVAAGILGGLVSSTATTLSYSRRSLEMASAGILSAFVIMVASTVVFARVLVLALTIAPQTLTQIGPPLLAMFVSLAVICLVMGSFGRGEAVQMPTFTNPTELKSAVLFGLLYAIVLICIAAGKEFFGELGLFAVAVMSGLTDMDALTLTTLQMVKDSQIEASTGWRLIMVGSLSNIVFKGGIAIALGSRLFARRLTVAFGLSLISGALILIFWPV